MKVKCLKKIMATSQGSDQLHQNKIFIKHRIGVVNIDMKEHISFAKLPTFSIYKCDALLFWFGSQQNGYTLKASPKSIQLQLEC